MNLLPLILSKPNCEYQPQPKFPLCLVLAPIYHHTLGMETAPNPPDSSHPIHHEKYLGFGANGEVVLHGDKAVKRPRRFDLTNADDHQKKQLQWLMHVSHLKILNESKIYNHLGPHNRIIAASCDVDNHHHIINMPYMKDGSLDRFLLRQKPEKALQVRWAQQLAEAVAYCHRRNVLLGDIGSRNCLLDKDLSLKLCDFGDAVIIEEGLDLTKANDSGVTIRTDIAQVGVVFYEICTGQVLNHGGVRVPQFIEEEGDFECEADPTEPGWPEEALPSTDGLYFGDIIHKCWTKAFPSIDGLCESLSQFSAQ